MNKVKWHYYRIKSILQGYWKIGKKSIVCKPLEIINSGNISIGNSTYIADYSWIIASMRNHSIKIGDCVTIGHFSHIVGLYGLNIGDSVLIADKVYITDCTHEYKDVSLPIGKQSVSELKKISIGEETWIGENVSIIGACIGKHCVIGANSVVTKDIPDYSVAVGAPAKIIKRYNFNTGQWDDFK